MEAKHPGRHLSFRYLAILILILAAGLRFYNLNNRGIFDYDEAWYLLEGKTLYNTLQFTWHKATEKKTEHRRLKDYLKERGTVPVTSFKPGHTLLVLLGLLCFGPNDYASFAVSALLGTLTVYLLYRLTARIYGPTVGILAGLILALSPFHIGYSRAGYAQANSLFFVALGLYLWVAQRGKESRGATRLFLSGCAVGYAFTCHFNLFTIPPLLLACETFYILKRRAYFSTTYSRIRRLATLGLGLGLPPFLFELPARLLRLAGRLPDGQQTYFEQFLYRGRLAGELHLSFSGASALLEKLLVSEGALIVAGMGIAIVWAGLKFRTTTFEDRAVLALFFVPALPWSILSVGLPPLYRTFAVLSLPVSILSAAGLIRLSAWLSQRLPAGRRLALPLIYLLILGNGIFHVKGLLPVRSTYREATDAWIAHLEQHGGRISFFPGSAWPIWYFYLSARYDRLSPELKQQVAFYPGQKDAMPPDGDFDAFDLKRYLRALAVDQPELLAYAEQLRNAHQTVVRLFNPVSEMPIAYAEVGGNDFKKTWQALEELLPSRYIEIYDLRTESPFGQEKASRHRQSRADKVAQK